MSDGGKGSAPRPFSVSNEEYAKRWDAIFGRDQEDDKPTGMSDIASKVLPQTVKDNVERFTDESNST